jgi:hypothetical protein
LSETQGDLRLSYISLTQKARHVAHVTLLNPLKEGHIMEKNTATVHVPSATHALMAVQYLLVIIGALLLAGLGVWLQHTLGNHSQVLSAQELTAPAAFAPQLKYDDEGNEMPLAFPNTEEQSVQRDWLVEELPPQF